MKRFLTLLAIATLTVAGTFSITADEGMYPLSELGRLNLRAKGLKLDPKEVYNPDGPSLVDAICRVGGGTGEFVSKDGLILTNHHIAFSGVSGASTPEHDYLKNGFTAHTREQEIPAKDYTCLITEKYRDVSAEVLAAATPSMSPSERSTAIRAKMVSLAKAEEAGRANISCEVSEMFPGKSYVLFTYRLITDVRLVYVPPIGVGNFGGEIDNWVWPRHTGDFSFLRAYVAPDGSTRAYDKANVPFTPKRWLKIAPRGVRENDFVMILGYPGRTYRHKTSHYVDLHERVQLPYISMRFDRMIAAVEEASAGNRALELMYADYVKGLANATKNYKGKMQGLRRLKLVDEKRAEEAQLQGFIEKTPALAAKYASTLGDLAKVYGEQMTWMKQELVFGQIARNRLVTAASQVLAYANAKERTAEQREKLRGVITAAFDEMDAGIELLLLSGLVADAAQLPEAQRLFSISALAGASARGRAGETAAHAALVAGSPLASSKDALVGAIDRSAAEIEASGDLVFRLASAVREMTPAVRERTRTRDGELTRLEADLLEAKMAWKKGSFLPDANSTLRLTYGYVRGYAPADAVRYAPQTTLRGIIEKNRGEEPFDAPVRLLELYNTGKIDKSYVDPVLGDVPVAMLYNMDTTGGNSGSPVLNARGELVGVNFDRTFEATINDYKWSESYSRSIGADIRYVLFVARHLGGADFLLKELGV